MTDTQRENLEVYIWEDDEADETTSSVTEETVSEEGLADARGRKAGRAKALFVGLLFALGFGGVLLGGAFWFLHAAEQSDLAAGASPVVETVGETELAQRLLAWQEERRQEAQRKAEEERLRREAEEAERARLEYEALLAATPEEVTLVFGGDILFDDRYAAGQTMAARGGMAPCLEEGVLAVLQDADLAILNNEFPYTDGGTPLADKQYTFRAPTRTVEWLGEAGVDLVALANNHCFDYGEAGFLDTLRTLEEAEMPYMGAGRNLEEAAAPARYTFGVFSVAILNATQIERDAVPNTRGATETEPGVFRCMDPEELYRRIAQAKEEADYVIVFVHWGTEKETSPDWLQLEQKEGMEKAGADLIIGAHPHVLQGITFENDTPVVYSLGNFLFTSYTIDTGLLQVTFSPKEKKLSGLRLVPMRQEGATVKLLQGAEKEAHLDKLRELSPGVVIDDEGGILLP